MLTYTCVHMCRAVYLLFFFVVRFTGKIFFIYSKIIVDLLFLILPQYLTPKI